MGRVEVYAWEDWFGLRAERRVLFDRRHRLDAGKRVVRYGMVRYGMASATVPCMSLEAKIGPLCPAVHRHCDGRGW